KNDKNDGLQVPPGEGDANREQKNRRQDETPPEALEQSAIPISADHPRQMMPGSAERCDKKVNVLRPPPGLRQSEKRQDKNRRADVQNQVTPAAQDPQVPFRNALRYRWDSLRT